MNLLLSIFNQILKANEGSLLLLKQYRHKAFTLNIATITISAVINDDGTLLAFDNTCLSAPHVTITIPLSACTSLITAGEFAAMRNIIFTGDSAFGREILTIFSKLNIRDSYYTLTPAKLLPLLLVKRIISTICNQINTMLHNASISASEYLLYENSALVSVREMREFCDAVDSINNRITKLAKAFEKPATAGGISEKPTSRTRVSRIGFSC